MKEDLLALSELIDEIVKKHGIIYFSSFCFKNGTAHIDVQKEGSDELLTLYELEGED